MKIPFYLVVNKAGSVKALKTRPGLRHDEICVGMILNIPDQIFNKPFITAEVTIPNDAVNPQEITAEVADNIKEAVQQSTDLQVILTVKTENGDTGNG